MRTVRDECRRWFGTAVLAACMGLVVGCGGVKTYPVTGKVSLKGGDVRRLYLCQVQLESEPDGKQKAVGEIQDDGSFSLMSNVEGQGRQGAPAGTYKARILPSSSIEDDSEYRKLIHPRYRNFATSGLTVTVPSSSPILFELEKPTKR